VKPVLLPDPTLPERVQSVTKGATATTNSIDPAERVIDKDRLSAWTVKGHTGWLQLDLPVELPVTHYWVGVGDAKESADPRDWKLKGSVDAKVWEDLDVRIGERFPARASIKGYNVSNSKAFRHYRLEIGYNNGGEITALSEWDLFADPSPPKPMTPVMVEPTLTARFFPTETESTVFLDVATNSATTTTAKPRWTLTRQKWVITPPKPPEPLKAGQKAPEPPKYKLLAEIGITIVQATQRSVTLATPVWPTQANQIVQGNQPYGNLQIREDEGLISLVALGPNGSEVSSEPILKLGAKKGESWVKKLPNGDNQTYILESLENGPAGTLRATIKTTGPTAPSRTIKGATEALTTTWILDAGIGEVERVVDREVTYQGKMTTIPLLSVKRQ
jgi:hypothetical protein